MSRMLEKLLGIEMDFAINDAVPWASLESRGNIHTQQERKGRSTSFNKNQTFGVKTGKHLQDELSMAVLCQVDPACKPHSRLNGLKMDAQLEPKRSELFCCC